MSFEWLHAEYLRWVKETFPNETPREQWVHLHEEFEELGEDLTKADEYADVLMLLCCVAHGHGVDIFAAFRDKFAVNKARVWKKTERGFRHVEGAKDIATERATATPDSTTPPPMAPGPKLPNIVFTEEGSQK